MVKHNLPTKPKETFIIYIKKPDSHNGASFFYNFIFFRLKGGAGSLLQHAEMAQFSTNVKTQKMTNILTNYLN